MKTYLRIINGEHDLTEVVEDIKKDKAYWKKYPSLTPRYFELKEVK